MFAETTTSVIFNTFPSHPLLLPSRTAGRRTLQTDRQPPLPASQDFNINNMVQRVADMLELAIRHV